MKLLLIFLLLIPSLLWAEWVFEEGYYDYCSDSSETVYDPHHLCNDWVPSEEWNVFLVVEEELIVKRQPPGQSKKEEPSDKKKPPGQDSDKKQPPGQAKKEDPPFEYDPCDEPSDTVYEGICEEVVLKTVRLEWQASLGATRYTIYWSTDPNNTHPNIIMIHNIQNYTIRDLLASNNHFFYVTATNKFGLESGPSNIYHSIGR